MDLSAEHIGLEPAGTRLVAPLARLGASGESLLAIASAGRDQGAAFARASTELSPLSMLLGRLASVDAGETPVAAAPLAELPFHAPDAARGLQKNLSQNGLFYESHLVRWAEGRHSIEDLRQEPQARASRDASQADTAQVSTSPVAEELAPLVRRQLEFIENPTLYWRGDVWPGQSASLEIRHEHRNSGDSAAEAAAENANAWTTRLRLELPQLGGIEALLTLHENCVAFSIGAAGAQAAATLTESRPDLQAALTAQGVRMEKFSVNTGVPADVPR